MTCFLVVDPHCSRKAYYVIYIFLLESVSVRSPRTQSSRLRGQRMSSSRPARVAFRGAFSWKKRTASLVTTQVNTAELRAEE